MSILQLKVNDQYYKDNIIEMSRQVQQNENDVPKITLKITYFSCNIDYISFSPIL